MPHLPVLAHCTYRFERLGNCMKLRLLSVPVCVPLTGLQLPMLTLGPTVTPPIYYEGHRREQVPSPGITPFGSFWEVSPFAFISKDDVMILYVNFVIAHTSLAKRSHVPGQKITIFTCKIRFSCIRITKCLGRMAQDQMLHLQLNLSFPIRQKMKLCICI